MNCSASNVYLSIAVVLGLTVSFSLNAFTNSFVAEAFNVATVSSLERQHTTTTPFIKVISPRVVHEVISPLNIKGQARREWFFEASMYVEIRDDAGVLLGSGPVTTRDDWMTNEIVSFEGVIPFDSSVEKSGVLIFTQEDPSGEGKRIVVYKYPVFFKKQVVTDTCSINDCGSQVCSPEEGASCEWSPESVCYNKAVCERQSSGLCGFTKTEAFKLCMSQL